MCSSIAAMESLRLRADVGEHAAAARGRDAQRRCGMRRVEAEQIRARNRRGKRSDDAGRMQRELRRLDLPRRHPQPALSLDAFGKRTEQRIPMWRAALPLAQFGQREQCGQLRRYRVVRRVPHGFEVEHMHRHAVDARRDGGRRAECMPDDSRRSVSLLMLFREFGHMRRPRLRSTRCGHREAVEQNQPAAVDKSRVICVPAENPLGELV